MKKTFFLLSFLLFTLAISAGSANAQEFFTIDSFHSDIVVYEDSRVQVKENIEVNFSSERHGIFRTIPYRYQRGTTNFNVRYRVLNVSDEAGNGIPYEISREGDNFKIKIGDPDEYVSGKQTYVIVYEMRRVINFFNAHDELYFNVTGNEWPVPISKASAKVALPSELKSGEWKYEAFTGSFGSTDQDNVETTVFDTGNSIEFESKGGLDAYQGMTIVVGWPKGIVEKPNFWQEFLWFIRDNWYYSLILVLPLLTFLIMLRLWHKYGRDEKIERSIAPEFSPPDELKPAELGTLIDEKVDIRDITATVIDLARRGYLKIVESKKDKFFGSKTEYQFVKSGKSPSGGQLSAYESTVYAALFNKGDIVTERDLKNEFYTKLPGIKDGVYKELIGKKYFANNPEKIRKKYFGIGIVVIIASFFVADILFFVTWPALVGLLLSGVVILIFSKFMPKKTMLGLETLHKIKGFEMFMNTAEKYRQKFFEDKNIFHRYLPYAISLGLAAKWAEAFKGIAQERPDYYVGTGRFNAYYFGHSMDDMSRGLGTAMAAAPRSSASSGGSGFGGGGFSGGGFGGGGGGSW